MSGIGILIAIAIITTAAHSKVHPSPLHYQESWGALEVSDLCSIFHQPTHIEIIDSHYYFNKILLRLNNNIECHKPLLYNPSIHTLLVASNNKELGKQAYRLIINQTGIFTEYGDYSGYVYALESFYQLARKSIRMHRLQFVTIVDEPRLPHRGIMIDTARHFLQKSTIERLISNMPLSKLNTLHWHMADDESFPVQLGSHPELAQYGNYNPKKVYSTSDLRSLISLAAKNGVKIIPEIQTPGHMRSWFLAPTWKSKNLTINCNIPGETGRYSEILDPSKGEALQLVQEVLSQIDQMFRDSPYIHLGGKGISFDCWNTRPEIAKTFMKLHNIKDYNGLIQYWRYQVKQAVPSSRKVIYWADQVNNYTTSPSDILQFTGNTSDLPTLMDKTQNMFILSPFNMSDLTTGLGNLWLNDTNGQYNSWRGIYEEYSELINSIDVNRVLGAQLLAWGTMVNDDNFDNNVWMRAAIFGERLWSAAALPTYQLVAAMVEVQRTLEENGVDVSPITSEYCEYKPQLCWPDSALSQESSVNIQIS